MNLIKIIIRDVSWSPLMEQKYVHSRVSTHMKYFYFNVIHILYIFSLHFPSYGFLQIQNKLEFYIYSVKQPTKAQLQLIYKLSRSYMFRHYRVIFRQFVFIISPSCVSVSNNSAVGNTI